MFISHRLFNHYQTLGIGYRASGSEIKSAFRILAKKYHPDQNPNNPDAETKFRKAKEAYECLSNKVTRAEYDRDSLQTGRLKWSRASSESDEVERNEAGGNLTRAQLIILYAVTIGLPFLASVIRRRKGDIQIESKSANIIDWMGHPPVPEVSASDVIVRAFYNPLTSRWERLSDSSDPPSPKELLQHFVREHRGIYKELLKSNQVRVPGQDVFLSVYEVPFRLTNDPILVRDRKSQALGSFFHSDQPSPS